jgi:hypothetical protein
MVVVKMAVNSDFSGLAWSFLSFSKACVVEQEPNDRKAMTLRMLNCCGNVMFENTL